MWWWEQPNSEKELEDNKREAERLAGETNEHIGRLRIKFKYHASTYTRLTRKI